MNPILNQLFGNNLFDMFRCVKNAQNPNMMMQSLIQTNPQMKQVMEVINQNGGNAKQAFFNLAQQKGKDPNEIINFLKNT